MKFPNKVTGINESILPYLLKLMKIISLRPVDIAILYKESKINDASLFADALACLYALNRIKFNDNEELELC